jgi:hypothetical protein
MGGFSVRRSTEKLFFLLIEIHFHSLTHQGEPFKLHPIFNFPLSHGPKDQPQHSDFHFHASLLSFAIAHKHPATIPAIAAIAYKTQARFISVSPLSSGRVSMGGFSVGGSTEKLFLKKVQFFRESGANLLPYFIVRHRRPCSGIIFDGLNSGVFEVLQQGFRVFHNFTLCHNTPPILAIAHRHPARMPDMAAMTYKTQDHFILSLPLGKGRTLTA